MANTITLAKKYAALLDEAYKENARTAVLESDASLAREGANANEIVIPKLTMDGLADYSRSSGYVAGDVSLSWQTVQFNYERGRMFSVDAMDNEESQSIAFGSLAGEFVRTRQCLSLMPSALLPLRAQRASALLRRRFPQVRTLWLR